MHLRLENFDGPLDLLLHLIKAQELNIFNIPIVLITEQYLGFLKQVPELNFYIAGEYLAMAAQLIEIKATMLLPLLQNRIEDIPKSAEDIPEGDPRKQLVEQLLEYEAIKRAAEILGKAHALTKDVYRSGEPKRREEEFAQFEHPIQGNPFDLVIALERALLRFSSQNAAPRVVVRAQKITIQQRMGVIKKHLEVGMTTTVMELLRECVNRYEMIVTLMAVLELCQAHQVIVEQLQPFGDIDIRQGPQFGEAIGDVSAEAS